MKMARLCRDYGYKGLLGVGCTGDRWAQGFYFIFIFVLVFPLLSFSSPFLSLRYCALAGASFSCTLISWRIAYNSHRIQCLHG